MSEAQVAYVVAVIFLALFWVAWADDFLALKERFAWLGLKQIRERRKKRYEAANPMRLWKCRDCSQLWVSRDQPNGSFRFPVQSPIIVLYHQRRVGANFAEGQLDALKAIDLPPGRWNFDSWKTCGPISAIAVREQA